MELSFMKSITEIVLVFVVCLSFQFINVAGQGASESQIKLIEKKLAVLEDEWLNTYVSGDRAKYDQIVAEDFTGIDESAMLRTKAEDRALLPAARVPGGNAVNEDVQVRLYGKFAIVTGRIVTRFVAEGREIAGFKTRFTDTWAERDGRWLVVARHYSRYPQERTVAKIDPTTLSELLGKYEIAPGLVYEVLIENGKLFGAVAGQAKLELLPESELVFFTKVPAAIYLFTRDRSGKIARILFIQDGRVTPGKKI